MHEPPATILLRGPSKGSMSAILHIRIEGLNSRSITGNALQNLQKLRFKTLLGLRSKTFYSTRPFPGFPYQALLSVNSSISLHDQVMRIEKQNHSANTWNMAQASIPSRTGRPSSSLHRTKSNLQFEQTSYAVRRLWCPLGDMADFYQSFNHCIR